MARATDDPAIQASLGQCDTRYYEAGEPIADRLFDWIRSNQEKIRIGAG